MEAIGWTIDLDVTAGEIHLEHGQSGSTYVLDADGGLRVPGETDVGAELGGLRETLVSALQASEADHEAVTDGGQAGGCTIECDEATGEVTIESDTDISIESRSSISLDAPQIELAADGNATLEASGILTLQGSLIKLN